ncbi:hypothetical protein ACQ4PT_056283 [Festuca glaucescens]
MTSSLRFLAFLAALSPMAAAAQLRPDYYATTCPDLESIVRGAVYRSMAHSPVAAPATPRLFFHDCAVRVRMRRSRPHEPGRGDEWRSSDDQTLKPEGFDTVMRAKATVDGDPRCRNKVSCADPTYSPWRRGTLSCPCVSAGRPGIIDATDAAIVELRGGAGQIQRRGMPHGIFGLDQLNTFFSDLGLSQTDMIALSGAHTIGAAACGFFEYRVGNETSGDDAAGMDARFAARLRARCLQRQRKPRRRVGVPLFLDGATPLLFDNATTVTCAAGGASILGSDQALYDDPRSRGGRGRLLRGLRRGDDEARQGRIGVRMAGNGEVRRDCRLPN